MYRPFMQSPVRQTGESQPPSHDTTPDVFAEVEGDALDTLATLQDLQDRLAAVAKSTGQPGREIVRVVFERVLKGEDLSGILRGMGAQNLPPLEHVQALVREVAEAEQITGKISEQGMGRLGSVVLRKLLRR